MTGLGDMLWIEFRKAFRSRLPLWTALGSLFMPLGIAFLLFAARNPQISRQLGLVSAKANLVAYAATDWPTYLSLFGQLIAAGGYILFVLVIAWVFGREFADGTVKDILAVPVPRASILLAKFILAAGWSALLVLVIVASGLLMGAVLGLPGASAQALLSGCALLTVTSALTIAAVTPFAFFASLGRGYLLPIGIAILALMLANVVMIAGWGEYYPYAVPGLYSQGKTILPAISYWIVLLTGLAGVLATYAWWMNADQSR